MMFEEIIKPEKKELSADIVKRISQYCKNNSIHVFSARELKKATKNYSRDKILSATQHFTLYQGVWKGDNISVKRYDLRYSDTDNVCSDIVVGSALRGHENVLKMVGCCVQNEDPLIVYEFVGGGDKILYDIYSKMPWIQRLQVGLGIANAIAHCHSMNILIQYISMHTILLDSQNVPKLFDFSGAIDLIVGLGMRLPLRYTKLPTCYNSAPEQFLQCSVGRKSDVYQLGKLLFQFLSRKGSRPNPPVEVLGYSEIKKNFKAIVDNKIFAEPVNPDHLLRFAELGSRCVSKSERDRPELTLVQEQLNNFIMELKGDSSSAADCKN